MNASKIRSGAWRLLLAFSPLVLAAPTAFGQVAFPPGSENGFSALPATKACGELTRYVSQNTRTFGLVILKNGRSVYESYGNGASSRQLFKQWSISKAFTGLLLGTLVQDQKISLDTPVRQLVPMGTNDADFSPDYRKRLTVRHLWTMSSGFQWCEDESCDASLPLQFFYGAGRNDVLRSFLSLPMIDAPGRVHRYNSGSSALLGALLRTAVGAEEYERLPEARLLRPLGIEDWGLERDERGAYLGGSGLFLGTRGVAKLGQFILQGGVWDGKRLVPEAFYREMITPSRAIRSPETPQETKNWEGPFGGLVWLNKDVPGVPSYMPHAPSDLIYAGGKFGQNLLIFPGAKLVVARNGGDAEFSALWVPFTDRVLACLAPDQLRSSRRDEEPAKIPSAIAEQLKTLGNLKKNNLVARMGAMELCNCVFLGRFGNLESCEKALPENELKRVFDWKGQLDREQHRVRVTARYKGLLGPLDGIIGGAAPDQVGVAEWSPERPHEGCRFIRDAR